MRPDQPVEQITYRTHFVVWSVILVGLTGWAIWDEVVLRRPWKGYQRTFKRIEMKKVNEEYQKYLKESFNSRRVETLKVKLSAEEKRLADSQEHQDALAALKQADLALAKWMAKRRVAKSEYDEAAYEFTHARQKQSSHVESYRRTMEVAKKKLDEVMRQTAAAQAARDAAKRTVDLQRAEYLALKSELEQLERPKIEFEEKIARVASRPIRIQQVMLPSLHRIDRCQSCHVGIDKKGLASPDLPLVYRSHPGNDLPPDHPKNLLAHHPIEKFGCTVCHHGDGEATQVKRAHGYEKNGELLHHMMEPMIKKPYLQASCAKCHEDTSKPGMEVVHRGKQLFKQFGCLACHKASHGWGERIAGWEGGPVSVDLAEIADKPQDEIDYAFVERPHTWDEYILQRLLNPQKVNPARPEQGIPYDSPMPNYGFSREDAMALTTLLHAFTREIKQIPEAYKVKDGQPLKALVDGRQVFVKYGCGACHGLNGEGGRVNYNYQGGPTKEKALIPPLQGLADKYTEAELVERIELGSQPEGKFDPNDVTPPLFMPKWRGIIAPQEMRALVKYLMTLKGPAGGGPSEDW